MKKLLTILFALVMTVSVFAQKREYTVMNLSPDAGVLKVEYNVTLSLIIENEAGMRISLYSDNIAITPGAKHTFNITPPYGFRVVSGTEAFRVTSGSCDVMSFTNESLTVKGNAAACQGVYNVTVWKVLGNDNFSISAGLMHGAAR
ncbi:MAG: hypothetical protein FD123_2978 [Bacteroidetes bacterium]|nr:MAG: hypothetical protein FD123_2978 [Bacteroidota bacterium]